MDGTQNSCKKCGAALPTGATFCAACGNTVETAEATQSPVTPQAPAASAPVAPQQPVTTSPGASVPQQPAATGYGAATPQQPTATGYSAATPQQPAATGYGAATPQQPTATGYSAATPQQPAATGYGAATPQQPAATGYGATTPQQPAATGYGATTPQQPAATGYGATTPQQPAATGYGATTPQQPAATGYGATTPQQPAATGYGVTTPQQPGYTGQPAAYGSAGGGYGGVPGTPGMPGYPTQPPAPKKKSPIIPIIAVLVVLAIIGGIVAIVVNNQRKAAIQAEYDTLVETICSSMSTSRVASQESKLRTFKTTYPDFEVDRDLEKLVDACVDYEDAYDDDEYKYSDMLETLDSLSRSSNSQVAACADRLYGIVQEDYDAYVQSLANPDPDEGDDGDDGDDGDGKLSYSTYAGFFSSGLYAFDVVNESNKTVVYFEVVLFAYDTEGNRINPDSRSWEFSSSDVGIGGKELAPGATAEYVGSINYCSGAYFGIPYFNYIEYSDGTSEGTKADLESDSFLSRVETQNLIYDILAMIVAPRLSSQPLYSEAVRKESYLAA